jgi:hypothetical protein
LPGSPFVATLLEYAALSINTLFILASVIALLAVAKLSVLHFLLPLQNGMSDFFVRAQVYLQYAKDCLEPGQIDAVDVAQIPGCTP